MKLVLAAIYFIIIIFTSLAYAESCFKRAKENYDHLIDAVANVYDGEIDSTIDDLRRLARTKCYKKSEIDFHYIDFDPETFEVGKETEARRLKFWQSTKDEIQQYAYRSKSAADYSIRAEAINRKILLLKPEGVIADVPTQQKSETERARACSEMSSINPQLPPIRNQADSGWCHFFAASDLLSFKYKKDFSPSYLGHLLSPTGSGGVTDDYLNETIHKFGLCTESTMPSDGLSQKYFDGLNRLKSDVAKVRAGAACKASIVSSEMMGRLPGHVFDLSQAIIDSFEKSGKLRKVNMPKIKDQQFGVSQNLALKQCERDRDFYSDISAKVNFKSIGVEKSKADRMNKIDELLNKGQPVNIGYDYDFLGVTTPPTYTHWSSIVGRRYINGQCQYQVRNSWGGFQCKNIVKEADRCSPPGHFWASAEDIYLGVLQIQYLE